MINLYGFKFLRGVQKPTITSDIEYLQEKLIQASGIPKEYFGGVDPCHGDGRDFSSVVFPVVRNVFTKLVANDIVSVTPKSHP